MKRLVAFTVLFLFLSAAAFGSTDKPVVVATHAVLGEFVQAVGGDFVDVVTIIPSGFCPSHYDLRPSDIAAVSQASLILYSGFEAWMDTLVSSVGHPVETLQLTGDWSTPATAIDKVNAIEAALAKLLPDDAKTFKANASAYERELGSLAADLKDKAAALLVGDVHVLCMQWQVSFVSWLGFDVVATYGIPESLSMKDLVKLAAAGREQGVQLVIDNLQSGIDFGAKLAREVDAVHVVLSNFPGALPNTATVLDLFKRNADSLFSSIAPVQ